MRFFKFFILIFFLYLFACDKNEGGNICLEMKDTKDDYSKFKFNTGDTIAFLSCVNPTTERIFDYGWQITYIPNYSVVHISENSNTYYVPEQSGLYEIQFDYSYIGSSSKEVRQETQTEQFIVSPNNSISFRIPRGNNVGPLGQTVFVKLFTENQIAIDSGYIYDYADEGQFCGGLNVLTFENQPYDTYWYYTKNMSTGSTSSSYLNHDDNCTYKNI